MVSLTLSLPIIATPHNLNFKYPTHWPPPLIFLAHSNTSTPTIFWLKRDLQSRSYHFPLSFILSTLMFTLYIIRIPVNHHSHCPVLTLVLLLTILSWKKYITGEIQLSLLSTCASRTKCDLKNTQPCSSGPLLTDNPRLSPWSILSPTLPFMISHFLLSSQTSKISSPNLILS